MNYVNVEPTDFDDVSERWDSVADSLFAPKVKGSIEHEGEVMPVLVRSHGLIIVQVVDGQHGKLLTMDHIVDLLDNMTPDELQKFQVDMQNIIDGWVGIVRARKANEL